MMAPQAWRREIERLDLQRDILVTMNLWLDLELIALANEDEWFTDLCDKVVCFLDELLWEVG